MIASLSGRVAALTPDSAVVEVGGVGIAVQCTPSTLATLRAGEQVRLATSLVVREDALTLYGFVDEDAREVFELVQTASGVGPRLAQAILGVLSPDAVRAAVATEDLAALTRVPGIGRKGAQRIVLELRDRLGPASAVPAAALPGESAPRWREQLREALTGLGWSGRDVDEAIAAVAPQAEADADLSVLLKSSLQLLSRAS